MSDPFVLIVGAGPSGLVLALTLLQNGVPVRIIDKNVRRNVGERGAGIMPRSLEVHEFLGTRKDFAPLWMHVPQTRMYDVDGATPIKTFSMSPYQEPTPDRPYTNPVLLGQNHQEAVLRSHLEKYSCYVEYASELRSFEQDDAGVTAHIAKYVDGQEVLEAARFAYLVGTDGAHSNETLRSKKDYPVKAGRELDHALVSSNRETFIEEFYSITNRKDIIFGELNWLSDYRPNIRMVDKFSAGRVFIAGDAAHCHSPTGGQGMNSSIQDSFNLGWKLALVHKGAKGCLLDTYSQERLPVIAEMLNLTTQVLSKTFKQKENENQAWDRSGNLHQLNVNYRGSSIIVDERSAVKSTSPYSGDATSLCAGDRAPNAIGLKDLGVTNNSGRLFDLFRPTYHTVLVFSVDQAAQLSLLDILKSHGEHFRSVLILPRDEDDVPGEMTPQYHYMFKDCEGNAHKTYGVDEGVAVLGVVIRPDGYIGAIVQSPLGLQRYLGGIFA
uniref:FAD-binding protein n=1 Tax=Volvariella volvacea TaxID=36659 RepID=M9Z537_9AGAR|nr:FAD-binding protein [Volvariella volvacea]